MVGRTSDTRFAQSRAPGAIRARLEAAGPSVPSSIEFLALVVSALAGARRRLRVAVENLPPILERPGSSPAKPIDEYLWMRITKNLGPSPDEPAVLG